MSKHQEQIIAAAVGKVSEPIVAAAWAKPRGATTAVAGGGVIVGAIGGKQVRNQRKGAEAAGIDLASPGAVAVISARGGDFKLEGKVGDMKEFAEAFDRVKAASA